MKSIPLLALVGFAVVSCAREAPVAPPPPSSALDVPKMDAGAAPAASLHARARGEVTASILGREGDFWGQYYEIAPSPSEVVTPCYQQALAGDPSLVGWATFDLEPFVGGSRVALAEASPLPKALLVCIEVALKRIHIKDDRGSTQLPKSLLYVTLR